MSHIFISYSHTDSDYAHSLAAALEQNGFSVWIDDRIDYGTQWPRVIQEHLDECFAFIVIMTPRAYQSDWVQNELNRAKRKKKPIFPLLLEGDEPWLSVEATQYVDVRGSRLPPPDFHHRLQKVLGAPLQPRQDFEPEMVLIPAGEFLMGSDPTKDKDVQQDREQPQHTLYLPDYYIAKTPVTNVQYAAFVEATRYQQPKHWKKGKPPVGKEDHPVVYVSWYDALAYCRWLADVTGRVYRLPSEAEWEKAARGSQALIYPWGNQWAADRCNAGEGGQGDTTPVGAYPNGASPYGLLDCAGNVWEWTRSLWGQEGEKPSFKYPYQPEDGREELNASDEVLRVVRGGAWDDNKIVARCAFRGKSGPINRYNNFGFRLVYPIK